MARQIGIVLGVAGLVGILANIVPGDPVSAFRHGLTLIIGLIATAPACSRAACSPAGQLPAS